MGVRFSPSSFIILIVVVCKGVNRNGCMTLGFSLWWCCDFIMITNRYIYKEIIILIIMKTLRYRLFGKPKNFSDVEDFFVREGVTDVGITPHLNRRYSAWEGQTHKLEAIYAYGDSEEGSVCPTERIYPGTGPTEADVRKYNERLRLHMHRLKSLGIKVRNPGNFFR
jgi:hypothetical protein